MDQKEIDRIKGLAGEQKLLTGVYALKDLKGGVCNQPFFVENHAIAIRNFKIALADSENVIAKFPSEFALIFIGVYDRETGKIEALPEPLVLGDGTQFVERQGIPRTELR